MNLLFNRGIFEFTSVDKAKEIALSKNVRYIVSLGLESKEQWNMYNLGTAEVYDLLTGQEIELEVVDKIVQVLYK